MTRELLNTLYVQTQEARLNLKDDTVKIMHEDETILRVPLHHITAIYAFGVVHISSPLMMRCADDGRSVAFFDKGGRFRASVHGKTSGNVLLRAAQWNSHRDYSARMQIARAIVAGKLQNQRQVLMRARRDLGEKAKPKLSDAIDQLALGIGQLSEVTMIDELQGAEGAAASLYFQNFDDMISVPPSDFAFVIRSRRPPRDRVNALLSFLYSISTTDCVGALEGVGLDPQVGFLHALRPGRPALALDLIEEFRSVVLDRLCLTMINRRQISPQDFDDREGGSCMLNSDGRKKVLAAYQERKREEVAHKLFKEKIPIGLLPHVQARVLARALRGDIRTYIPYTPC